MFEAFDYPFFQRAVIAGVLASIACGLVGTFVVVKRISSIAGGLSHAAFGGVGLGYWLGFNPLIGATAFALGCSALLGFAHRRMEPKLDTLISTIWAGGMALGLVFVALTPGFAPDLMSYLFGSILFVPVSYLQLTLALDIVLAVTILLLFKELQAVSFDEEFARVMGVPVAWIFQILLALSALVVVTLIRVVGTILVIALLTVPAAIARQWSDDLRRMMVGASFIGAVCSTSGLLISYQLSSSTGVQVPAGPLIVLIALAFYGISSLIIWLRR